MTGREENAEAEVEDKEELEERRHRQAEASPIALSERNGELALTSEATFHAAERASLWSIAIVVSTGVEQATGSGR